MLTNLAPGPRAPRLPGNAPTIGVAPNIYYELPVLDNTPFYPNFTRVHQDIAVPPTAPRASGPIGSIGVNESQYLELQADLATALRMKSTDIRVNQQQVNASGVRVGTNRPDLQFTLPNKQRIYVEYDTPGSQRGLPHLYRTQANDPIGKIILKTIPNEWAKQDEQL
jgi:hypothetical protein